MSSKSNNSTQQATPSHHSHEDASSHKKKKDKKEKKRKHDQSSEEEESDREQQQQQTVTNKKQKSDVKEQQSAAASSTTTTSSGKTDPKNDKTNNNNATNVVATNNAASSLNKNIIPKGKRFDAFAPRVDSKNWNLLLTRQKLKSWSLGSISTNTKSARMWKVMAGNSDLEIRPPPLKTRRGVLYHGVGALAKESLNGDPDRKFKGTFERLIPDSPNGPKNPNLNAFDREIIAECPSYIEECANFKKALDEMVLNRIIQLYIKATHPDLAQDVKDKSILLRLELDLSKKTDITLAVAAISDELLEDLLESEDPIQLKYGAILKQLIDEEKKRVSNWNNKGGKPGIKTDAELGIDAIRTSTKVFYSTKKKTDDQGKKDNNNNNTNNSNNNTTVSLGQQQQQKSSEPKNLDDEDSSKVGGGGQAENTGEEDFIPDEGSFGKMSRQQINLITTKLCGGRKPEYRYSKPSFMTVDGAMIDRSGKPAHEQFLFGNDYAAPIFKIMVTEVQSSVYIALSSSKIIFVKQGLRDHSVSEEDLARQEEYETTGGADHQQQQTTSGASQFPVNHTEV